MDQLGQHFDFPSIYKRNAVQPYVLPGKTTHLQII